MNQGWLLGIAPVGGVVAALLVNHFWNEPGLADQLSSPVLSIQLVTAPSVLPQPTDGADRLFTSPIAPSAEEELGAESVPSIRKSRTVIENEESNIRQLRTLLGNNPSEAVRLARRGEAEFQNTEYAAERNWILVKSLTDLGSYEEARRAAEDMLARYADTDWGRDVKRHVLTHPAGTFERGL